LHQPRRTGGTVIEDRRGDVVLLKIIRVGPKGARIKRGKGLNFQDTGLNLSALSKKDTRDLAIELGSVRMAGIQEEILWLCEAAHIPVIWATQVFETLTKNGVTSRAGITDAAMAVRAECVMLNKGAYIQHAVTILSDVLQRMEAHQYKKISRLRAPTGNTICLCKADTGP